jgi:hypothetical protein
VLGSALVLFAFSLLNKQSFFNEWWLVGALILLAAATAIAEGTQQDQSTDSAVDASFP